MLMPSLGSPWDQGQRRWEQLAQSGRARGTGGIVQDWLGAQTPWILVSKGLNFSPLLVPSAHHLAFCSPSLGYQSPPGQPKGQGHLFSHTPPLPPCASHEHLSSRPGLLHHVPTRGTLKHCQVSGPQGMPCILCKVASGHPSADCFPISPIMVAAKVGEEPE